VIDVGIFFGRPDRSQVLAQRLRRLGFRVTLYGRAEAPGTEVPVPYALGPALRRLLATRHDVYLTGLTFMPSIALYLQRVLRRRPYVFNAAAVLPAMYRDRARGWPVPRLAERWVYPFLGNRILAGSAAIVCNSRYLHAALEAGHPAWREKLTTIYNGVDFQRFASGRPAALDGVPAGAPTLAAVMTWDYRDKAEAARVLMDAMGPITRRCPAARLVIAARARRRGHAEANEAYLATLPWRSSVTILYDRQDVPDVLAAADLFVYATRDASNDSLPRALLEAHAAGLAIVTTAAAGCAEVVEHGATGFVVPADPEAIADRALALLADAEMRRRFGTRGQARVREVFSWERMADGYAHVFRDVCAAATKTIEAPHPRSRPGKPGTALETPVRSRVRRGRA
jgi:glycosyltransferase involved in cell wall biosynthesis